MIRISAGGGRCGAALFAAMTRWFYRRADAVVVTSQGVADDLAVALRRAARQD